MTGILIVATGHPHYVNLAINLAASIKYNAPQLRTCIVHDGGYASLTGPRKTLFDDEIYVSSNEAFKIKTQLYRISPYDRTLYLDADTIILPNVNLVGFIHQLKGFNIINTGRGKDYCIWADPEAIRGLTGNNTNPLHQYFSEMIFFEKNDKMENFFKEVEYAYSNTDIQYKTIADQMPDELAYTIASIRTGVMPDIIDWCPLFWHFRNRKDSSMQSYQLSKKYIGYSIGGNVIPEYVKASYNNYVSFYEHKLGIKGLTKAIDKRLIFRNRIKL